MSDSLRCPFCGWTGAARRTATECEYLPDGGPASEGPGPLLRQTDKYECEVCAQVWDEETYRRPQSGRSLPRPKAGRTKSSTREKIRKSKLASDRAAAGRDGVHPLVEGP
jgi:hypothetical protein